MLDSEANIDIEQAEGEGQDTLTGEDTLAPEEPGEIVITIEGEEPPVDEDAEIEAELGEKGVRALRAARQAAKEAARKNRELEAKLAEREKPPVEVELKRPEFKDYDFDEARYAAAFEEYTEKKKQVDAKRKAAEDEARAAKEAYDAKVARYFAEREKVGIDDDAQAVVVSALNEQQQAALMDACGDPVKVVAALSRNPKVLEQLASIKQIHRFAYELARVEGRIQMTTKTPPPPESKLRGSVSPETSTLSAQLAAAEAQFERTGDRGPVLAIKRKMAAAGAA